MTPIDRASLGPPWGTRFPDVVLRDQHGRTRDLHAYREGRPARLVVLRSAVW